jgi:hypothetical protein
VVQPPLQPWVLQLPPNEDALATALVELQQKGRDRAATAQATVEQQIEHQQRTIEALQAELESLKAAAKPLQERADLQGAALDWAARRFDPGIPAGEAEEARPRRGEDRLAWEARRRKWRQLRGLTGDPSLAMTPGLRSAVFSGRALNVLLDQCSAAALEHDTYSKRLDSEIERWMVEQAATDDEARRESLDEFIRIAEYKRQVLAELDGKVHLEPEDIASVRCTKGLTGAKLTVLLSDDPLPLDWPLLLQTSSELDPYREAVEEAKDAVIAELDAGRTVDAAAARQLMTAVADLDLAFEKLYLAFFQSVRDGATPGATAFEQHLAGKRFLAAVRHGVPRLLAADGRNELIEGAFAGRTARDLLAFMSRNGLRFAEIPQADLKAGDVHERVFRMLVEYYMDLQRMNLVFHRDERELAASLEVVASGEEAVAAAQQDERQLAAERARLLEVSLGQDRGSRLERAALIGLPHVPALLEGGADVIRALGGK